VKRRTSITASVALVGAMVAVGLVGVAGTATAALPTFQHDRDVVFFDFGEMTDPSTKVTANGAEITDGLPFTGPATPINPTGVGLVDDTGTVVASGATGVNNGGTRFVVDLPASGRDYTDVKALGFISTLRVQVTSPALDSQNLVQKGIANANDDFGQYKLQVKKSTSATKLDGDDPQCRFEDDRSDGGSAADVLLITAPSGADIVGNGLWDVSCWRDDAGTTLVTDDVFGVTVSNGAATPLETTALNNGVSTTNVTWTLGPGGNNSIDSLTNTNANGTGRLVMGGNSDTVSSDTCTSCKFYDHTLTVNDPTILPPTAHPLDQDNIDGWTSVGSWGFVSDGSSGAACRPRVRDDFAGGTSPLLKCGDAPFRKTPTRVLYRDGSYSSTATLTKFNPGNADFRVYAKFRPTALPTGTAPVVQKGFSGARWRLTIDQTGSVGCTFSDSTNAVPVSTPAGTVAAGSWYTANCIRWNDTVWLYVGTPAEGPDITAPGPIGGWAAISNSDDLIVARRDKATSLGTTYQFKGDIDAIRIWKGHVAI
jgi:hypothetical protein